MTTIRTPAVAGTFYSANPTELATSVGAMLSAAEAKGPVPKAIIAPHAGHVYSGPIAATVYARLKPAHATIKRVVLLGPSHRVGFRGIAASNATAYRTPLGDIPIDVNAIREVTQLPSTGYLDEAHAQEHSLEVHLPFLQQVIDDFQLVPLVVGDANKEDVARVLEALWGDDETLIVISSDLSHYHPYAEARQIDASTSRKILSLDSTLRGEEACGCRPINGLLHLAKERGYRVEQLDVRNSGDTAGSHDRVVGYGAYMIVTDAGNGTKKSNRSSEPESELSLAHRQSLLHVAREAIDRSLKGERYSLDPKQFSPDLNVERASFVTLNIDGRLRGCIGSLVAHRPLVVDVAHNAVSAAFKDPRFKPLAANEWPNVDLHLSILTVPEELDIGSREQLMKELVPGRDGLIIEENGQRATYLPSVWKQIETPAQFVSELRRKAGLNPTTWSAATRVFRYFTEEFC